MWQDQLFLLDRMLVPLVLLYTGTQLQLFEFFRIFHKDGNLFDLPCENVFPLGVSISLIQKRDCSVVV